MSQRPHGRAPSCSSCFKARADFTRPVHWLFCVVRRLRAGSKQRSVTGRHCAAQHPEHLRRIELVG